MSNHLVHENSPYLLQHVDNPVDWYPWGKEALEKAKSEDKPIFLSIGYAACHWCHVMMHESFEDQEIAEILNKHFVSVKVDREERPDLDSIYMQAVVAMTGQGGWPLSVFLTPDGKPFYGGTYFPPERRYNLPSFREVLLSIVRLWRDDHARIMESSLRISEHLQPLTFMSQSQTPLRKGLLDQAVLKLAQSYDWNYGGWGSAPKFPQPMVLEFLLRRSSRGDKLARQVAVHALHAMSKGGMYDVVGGGFARYSTDDRWLIPHFEKMLYDNAQLAMVYLYGYLIQGEGKFRSVCEQTLDFVLREMTHPEGGFYSSLDADSEGQEGKFYVWDYAEIQQVLDEGFDFFKVAYGLIPQGNWEGKVILQRALDDSTLAEKFHLTPDETSAKLQACLSALLTVRNKRVRPGTDDKILVFWNALMLSTFAEAGRYLGRKDYLEAALRNARFLLENLYVGNRLLRSWRKGKAQHNAYLEDYASFVLALLILYQSDPNPEWYGHAIKLADEMVALFLDPAGGFFDTRVDHETLLVRPKDIQDNATPSGNALAALVLLQLAAYGDRAEWHKLAMQMLEGVQEVSVRYPTAFAKWLCAADFALGTSYEVVVLGQPHHPQTEALLQALWKTYRPYVVAAVSAYPPDPDSPALLRDRPLFNNQPTAYVCRGYVCLQPVNSPAELIAQLEGGAFDGSAQGPNAATPTE